MAEFKRLWELESGEHQITTVQAGTIICVSHNVDGLDKVGTSYLARAVAIGREMGIFTTATYASLSPKRKAVYAVTAQGMYAWARCVPYHPPVHPQATDRMRSAVLGKCRVEASSFMDSCWLTAMAITAAPCSI